MSIYPLAKNNYFHTVVIFIMPQTGLETQFDYLKNKITLPTLKHKVYTHKYSMNWSLSALKPQHVSQHPARMPAFGLQIGQSIYYTTKNDPHCPCSSEHRISHQTHILQTHMLSSSAANKPHSFCVLCRRTNPSIAQ